MLIRSVEGGLDVRVADGVVTELGPSLLPADDEEVVDAGGAALLPGLWDHHLHLRSLAASVASVPFSALGPGTGWVRVVGYHESEAGPLDRWVLDRLVGDRPVRVQHRSGELWVLSSAACRAVGLDDAHDGRLWRADAWLRDRVPPVEADLAAVGRRAASTGVVGFTDTTPGMSAADVASLASSGLVQRLCAMVPPSVPVPAGVVAGPHKLLLDDLTLPTVPDLAEVLAASPRGVAVHCVTRVQLLAFLAAGPRPGDRVEHGALIPADVLPLLAAAGVVVVTQPNFVAERADAYASELDADDLADLYRCRSLLDAGVAVAFGTDAPFGGADPWAAMRAAVDRALGEGERVAPAVALAAFLGSPLAPSAPRAVAVDSPADLCLLSVPLAVQLRELSAANVRLTLVGGTVVHGA